MAFKMKGFSGYGNSPAKKALVGAQNNLPEELKAKIEASPGKQKVSGKSLDNDMEGPIDRKNLKLQKGEMDGTYIFGRNFGDEGTTRGEGFEPTGTKDQKFTANERINDMEERASFLDEDMEMADDKYLGGGNKKKGKKVRATKQKTKENLEMEAQIMRDRRKNERKSKNNKK